MKKKRGFHFFEAGLLLYLNFNLQAIEFYGILLIKRKKLQKELFSQIIFVLLLCHTQPADSSPSDYSFLPTIPFVHDGLNNFLSTKARRIKRKTESSSST